MKRNFMAEISRTVSLLLVINLLTGIGAVHQTVSAGAVRFEAEDAVRGGNARVYNGQAGASGGSMMGSINLCYASMSTGKISIYLNNTHIMDAAFTATGGWAGIGCFNTIHLDLGINSGDNLKIQFDKADPSDAALNVDYIECIPLPRLEAENAAEGGSAKNFTGQAGASGTGLVGTINLTGSYVQFNHLPDAAAVGIRYASINAGTISIYLNDLHVRDAAFAATGG